MYDTIILGNGIAGMSAAIYVKRANLNFKIIGEDEFSAGQIENAVLVENYPGIKEITGYNLGNSIREQIEEMGIIIEEKKVESIEKIEANVDQLSDFFIIFVLFIKNPEILSVLAISYLALVVYGSFRISSNIYLKVKCFSRTFRKGLLLTFDDGPDPVNTQKILEILEKKNVKALFFITGSKAEKSPDLVKIISDKGHSAGNHSYSHSNFFPVAYNN